MDAAKNAAPFNSNVRETKIMHGRILIALSTLITITGCGPILEANRTLNRTPAESYDHGICNSGEHSRPGETVRYGCVNNISKEENREAFNYYQRERELYLNENK